MALATEGDCSSIEIAGIDGVTGCEKAHAFYQGAAALNFLYRPNEPWHFMRFSLRENRTRGPIQHPRTGN
jgi:hypothetical protein